jgi:hypothetical protein
MRRDAIITGGCIGWVSGDASSAKQVTSHALESFEVVW